MARGKTKYQRAVSWIAWNDEPEETDDIRVSEMISVACIADVFEKDPMQVAMDVTAYRERQDI